jgi:polyribonucleotide nucleotidyltransferase
MTATTDAESGITETEAVIDNGRFGKRTVRFETGRLAKQAAGSVVAYLDDETRPLRPTFIKGLRNEVQVVITVLALNPDHAYDVLAINAASASTQISGLPFNGPVGGTRVALIEGQWVGFPTHSELEKATFDMVVAGRVVSDAASGNDTVAIMMVEAEATENTIELIAGGATKPTEEVVAEGLEAAKPFIAELCRAQSELAQSAAKPVAEFPTFLDYSDEVYEAVDAAVSAELAGALTIADKQEREARLDEIKEDAVRGPLPRDQPGLPGADQEAGPPADPARQGPHRRPRAGRHPHALGRGRGRPAGARLGAVPARRDPDPGRHHAEHARARAEARHAEPGAHQAVHAQLQLPALLDR